MPIAKKSFFLYGWATAYLDLEGNLTPQGRVLRTLLRFMPSTLPLAAALDTTLFARRTFTSSTIPSAQLRRSSRREFTGEILAVSTVVAAKIVFRTLLASLDSGGSVTRQARLVLRSAVAIQSLIQRFVYLTLRTTVIPVSTLALRKIIRRAFDGIVTFTGSVVRRRGRIREIIATVFAAKEATQSLEPLTRNLYIDSIKPVVDPAVQAVEISVEVAQIATVQTVVVEVI